MAIVMQTASSASELRDTADAYNRQITSQTSKGELHLEVNGTEVDGEHEVVGIVTLENVIERILMTDIHDEKDRLAARNLKDRMATIVYRETHAN